jgi:hypothetical protein
VKLDLVFRQSDIDWLNFPMKVWSILSHDIDHTQSGKGKGSRVTPATVLVIRPRGSSIPIAHEAVNVRTA